MRYTVSLLLILFFSTLKAQEKETDYSVNFTLGISNLNHLRINNALQTGFSLEIPFKKSFTYKVAYQYLLGANIKADDLNFLGKTFNYNSHVQQSQFNSLIGKQAYSSSMIEVSIHAGISFNFLKQSFVNNIYLKEIVPNQPFQLVSESTFEQKFQLGSTTEITTVFKLGKFSPGINLQYQYQKEFQFFSPSVFLNYKL